MVQVKDLTELKLEDLWREVKWDDEDWWSDLIVPLTNGRFYC